MEAIDSISIQKKISIIKTMLRRSGEATVLAECLASMLEAWVPFPAPNKPDAVAHDDNLRQVDQKLKVILSYILSLRPVCAI